MPAYNFKEQFCRYVLDGTKPHTIRAYRNYPVSAGDTLSLYFGMRTKECQLLRRVKCTEVKTIAITDRGTVVMVECPRLDPAEVEGLKIALLLSDALSISEVDIYDYDKGCKRHSRPLSETEKNVLAWKDGFRPEGTRLHKPTGAFSHMMDFWRESHELPFVGNIIYWDPHNL